MNEEKRIIERISGLEDKVNTLINLVRRMPTTHNTNLGDWLTEEQAKELLGRSTTWLWELRKMNKVEWKKVRGSNYYNYNSILKFIENS